MQDGKVLEIRLQQKNFTEGPLDPVEIATVAVRETNEYGESMATAAEKHDHRSPVGGRGWLSAQSRPDLAFDTNEAQQHQNGPSLEDLKKTIR